MPRRFSIVCEPTNFKIDGKDLFRWDIVSAEGRFSLGARAENDRVLPIAQRLVLLLNAENA